MTRPAQTRRVRARLVGAGVTLVLLAASAALVAFHSSGWFDKPCLLLATVADAGKLAPGSPVFYRGLLVGKVVGVRPPTASTPGWRLRMAVDRAAFIHISTDARVRLQEGKKGEPTLVIILPGLSPADPDYPLDAKVLSEISTEEDAVRMIRDVLDGLADLSRAKRSEAEVIELREEVERLRRKLAELESTPKK